MRVNRRGNSEESNQEYVWAIKSTMDLDARQPIHFNTMVSEMGGDFRFGDEVSRYKKGLDFNRDVLPATGWFVRKCPSSVPSVFIASGFLVINDRVKGILESQVNLVALFHPFRLLDKVDGESLGVFYIVMVGISESRVIVEASGGSINKLPGSEHFKFSELASKEGSVVVSSRPQGEGMWIDSLLLNTVFFSDSTYKLIRPCLEKSNIALVKCLVRA